MGPKPGTSVSPAYPGVDLLAVARNVGEPSRSNCGSCHFFGGGGDRVKHGDLDSSMIDPDRDYDVHMGSPGADMSCQDCHVQDGHTIRGNSLVVSPGHPNSLECTDCHEDKPHDQSRINAHTDRVACQTCHIPTFAKGLPTKIYWNWSSAGEDREPETDRFGLPTYQTGKGSFVWDRDIVPHYAWYNGTGGAYAIGDRIKRRGITALNWPEGSRKDRDAKIYPFKIMRGIQPYDSYLNHKYLIVPKLYGDGGYWETYDWDRAARLGMESVGLDYSGEMAWTETVMYWKINHMVVPAENALDCLDCHGDRGRLEWRVLGYKKDPMD